jgi:energy-coupling factor transporter transmembrane protein EcfT
MRRPDVGPLALLAGCLLPVAGALVVSTPEAGFAALGAEPALFGWWVSDLRATALRLAFGLVAAASIAVSTYLYGGQDVATTLTASLRILVIVVPTALLTPGIDPSRLGDHLAQRLRLPARPVVAAVVALQRIDDLAETWRQVQRARRSRGLGLDGGPARRLAGSAHSAFALLVVSMRRTGTLSVAMDARGFAAARAGRTWAEPAPWRGGDWLMLTFALLVAVLPWWVRFG